MEELSGKEKRMHFRLKFQINDRPKLKVLRTDPEAMPDKKTFTYYIIDISEQGIRFRYTGGIVENPLKGTIYFHRSEPWTFSGNIIRIQNNQICLVLEEAIPLRILVKEQRYLFDKYGAIIEADGF